MMFSVRSPRTQTTNWSTWDTDMKTYRALRCIRCSVVWQTSPATLQWSEMKDSASHHGRNKKDCKGRAGRGRDSLLWFKTSEKGRHLAGVKTWEEMVCRGFTVAHSESKWWSPNTHFRRKLVRISVTSVGACTSRRKLHISVGLTPEVSSVVPKCRVRNSYRCIFIFSFPIGVTAVLCDKELDFGLFCSSVRPGSFLGTAKSSCAWVMLESGSSWDQKSNLNAPLPVLNSLPGPQALKQPHMDGVC